MRDLRRASKFLLAALLAALCAAFLASPASAESVADDTGHSLNFSTPARRIVSLAPHATELLFAAGAGGQLVGVSVYSDYPDAAKALPQVGGYQGLDLERIAALRPDLVVAWQSGNSAGQLDAIERMGIPMFRSEPKSLEDIATSLERLGLLSGHRGEAGEVAAAFRRRVDALRLRHIETKPVRVFYQVWTRPLMTIGGRHLISTIITLCGGRNIFERLETRAAAIDAEAVVAADPQLMVVASPDDASIDTSAGVPESLRIWRSWPQIAAVRTSSFAAIDPALITRAAPRIIEGAEILCRAIDKARQGSTSAGRAVSSRRTIDVSTQNHRDSH